VATVKLTDLKKYGWGLVSPETLKAALSRDYPGAFVVTDEELRWAICSENEITKRLDKIAEYASIIKNFRNRPKEGDLPDWYSPLEELGNILGQMIDAGPDAFREFSKEFANVLEELNSGFSNRSDEDKAIIYLLIGGRKLYMERRGAVFTKAELKARIRQFWIGDGYPARSFKGLNWPRIFEKVELNKAQVRDGKPGRKKLKL
jgi:hypothetical protein